nr:EOG090X05QS [Scapholeberis mucronata]
MTRVTSPSLTSFVTTVITYFILLSSSRSLFSSRPTVSNALTTVRLSRSIEATADSFTASTNYSSLNPRINNNTNGIGKAKRGSRSQRRQQHDKDGLSLWIDRQQVKMFSGFPMEILIAADGRVLPYILDPNFEKYLPIIPSEVGYVNFTWKSGESQKYFYHFDRLQSFNEDILQPPTVSVKTQGRVPRKPKVFSVLLPCSGNSSGVASFSIGLLIETHGGKPLPGTPLRLRLRKECAERGSNTKICMKNKGLASLRHGPDPECDKKCANGGWCNHDRICQCLEGYMGQHCRTALCYPQCMNGGSCTSPGMCSCPTGFQGRHCEGGLRKRWVRDWGGV